jgi:hypothetical protein
MNDDDGTIISDTTSEDSRTYMHTFPRTQMTERPPVIIECKPTVPKLKGYFVTNKTSLLIIHCYTTFGVMIVQSKQY